MNVRLWFGTLLLMCVAVSAGSQATGAENSRRLLHAVLVVVNGEKITQRDLDSAAAFIFFRMFPGRPYSNLLPEERDNLSERALRELVRIKLIQDEFKKLDLEEKPERYDRYYKILKIKPEMATPFERNYVKAEAMFEMIMNKDGIGYAKPGPRQIKEFWKENKKTMFVTQRRVKIRHIFLDLSLSELRPLRNQADRLRKEIMASKSEDRGRRFAELAEKYSQGRFRKHGGLLLIGGNTEGWFNQDFPNKGLGKAELFPEAMVRGIRMLQKKGELSEVIQSDKGLHLLYLEDAEGGEPIAFKTAQTYIEWHLGEIEKKKYMRRWMNKKLDTCSVSWHDGQSVSRERILPPVVSDEKAKKSIPRQFVN